MIRLVLLLNQFLQVSFLTIITALILTSCKKDIDIISFSNCNNSQGLDSATIAMKLSSSWLWSKQSCDGVGTRKADKNIKIIFNSIGTFSILENSIAIAQGTWKLKNIGGNLYELNLSQPSQYLYGRILFCDKQVLFNDSYRDGCDNLFTKSN
ncbi:MAG: hypothetical protein WKF85_14030 [Chitinophagaceae bacterium]